MRIRSSGAPRRAAFGEIAGGGCPMPNQLFRNGAGGTIRRLTAMSAIVLTVGWVTACRDVARSRTPSTAPSDAAESADQPTAQANQSRLLGVDDQDDLMAPACLPSSNREGAWVKREPVRIFGPAELARALPGGGADRLAHFRINSAAACAYALPHGRGTPFMASVLLIDTQTADDAYGILTCRCSSPELYKIGGETRVDHSRGLALHTWQGKHYLHVACEESDPFARDELTRLALHIATRIGREDRPSLLDALPSESLRPGRQWLVRHLASLPPDIVELGVPLEADRLSRVLGLGKDTLMAIASYDVPDAARPNTVFVVRYPGIKSAHDAYARYSRAISTSSAPLDASTSLLAPQGAYLAGTWTAEEESLQYLLPRIQELLPS